MYKEFRELSRADAVKALYQDMAARHRARFRSIHVCVCLRDISTRSAPSDRPGQYTDGSHRSPVLSRSRSPKTSAAPTSSSSLPRASSSPSLTVSPRRARRSSLRVPAPSKRLHCEAVGWTRDGVARKSWALSGCSPVMCVVLCTDDYDMLHVHICMITHGTPDYDRSEGKMIM